MRGLGFVAHYRARILPGLPGEGHGSLQFARPGQSIHREGLVVRVDGKDGGAWVGNFQRGPEGLDGVFPTPSPSVVCVVAGGQGYLVPVDNPTEYVVVDAMPIKEVRAIAAKGILIFVDYVRLVGYGPSGCLWRTRRLSWDGIRLTDVTPERIAGFGRDASQGTEVPFSVDVDTGRSEGGSTPEPESFS